MRVSRILLLVVALVAGGLAAFLATRGGGQPEAPAPQVAQDNHTQVLVAKADIGVGERLSDQDVGWQDWPESGVQSGYITQSATPQAISDMKGAVARFEIFPGEPIQQAKLVRSDQGYLSAVLDKGMRGVSISVDASSASGGFIVPNDHVDVILTHADASGSQTSETILSNVRVLAVNTRLGETGKTGAPDDPNDPKAEIFANTAIATLELDPSQAETVVNAAQLGKLALSLRSIVDFTPAPGDNTNIRRNAPIRIIRYGLEANVQSGAVPASDSDTDGVGGLAQPPVSVTVAPASPIPTPAPAVVTQSPS
ncbi:MAG TPA: Flp pilus assembly protein CpaB [Devosia sp.]|jgi:pilus assembly protein CpaB|nr:Flp pilus assembly protein CpaB [Devosia sp.]